MSLNKSINKVPLNLRTNRSHMRNNHGQLHPFNSGDGKRSNEKLPLITLNNSKLILLVYFWLLKLKLKSLFSTQRWNQG